MKFLHLSDLHLGKRVNEISMLEDQREILTKILALCDERRPEAMLTRGISMTAACPLPRRSDCSTIF